MEKRQPQEPKEKLHWALLIKEYPGNNPRAHQQSHP